jgi:3-deoxy-D-manno-octulosonic-acid transferase
LILLYNFFIQFYFIALRIAALWNKKAKEWVNGRKNLFDDLEEKIAAPHRIIWMHCSSAGEFEQGKPIIEQLKKAYPGHKIVVSFFSPSGFNVAQNYKYADAITYLPLDTRQNAKRFIELLNPELAIFIKYEFWYHHLSAAAFKHIPLLLVSAVFRKEQVFFKWYGKFYKQMLFLFRHVFVQDETSLQILNEAAINHCSISGDTRFDRVKEIRDNFKEIPFIKDFIGDKKVIVAGSTWAGDEQLLSEYPSSKFIIAPHEVHESNLEQIEKQFKNSIRYSQLKNAKGTEQTLIIDNVGMLSRLYHYATIAYVGGGFTKDGIHNILEAAVYGKAVLFGPNYKKYREAKELIAAGGAFSLADAVQLKNKLNDLLNDESELQSAGANAGNYIEQNLGATQKVVQFIQEKRLLTR